MKNVLKRIHQANNCYIFRPHAEHATRVKLQRFVGSRRKGLATNELSSAVRACFNPPMSFWSDSIQPMGSFINDDDDDDDDDDRI